MRNLVIAVLTYLFAIVPGVLASNAVAHTAQTAPPAKPSIKVERSRTKPAAHKKTAAKPVKWLCKGKETLWITGDMQRDQILTMRWGRKNYQLPRVQTTTGADRFYDPASGMNWIVIPSKAMLFNDKGQHKRRLADECRSPEMIAKDTPAPTRAEAIRKAH